MTPSSIVLFLLALTLSTTLANGQAQLNSSNDYDYFLLVSNRFSIHGLWPERLDGSWPSCCDSDYPFRIQKITDLLPELAHDWFSYTSGIKYQCSWDPVTADARATAPWTKRMVARVHQLLGSTWYPKIPGRALLGDAHDDHDDDLHHHEEHGDRHRHGHHNNKRRDAPHHHHGHDDLHAYDHKHHDNDGKANRDSPNYQFWRHEWEKHGTCSLDVLENEKEYFEAVLRLHRTFSIDVRWVHIDQAPPYINTIPPQMYLHDADIVPATDRYLYKDVVKAIATGAGAEPFISCKDGEVNEVWLCFDKELRIMDCPHHDAPSYQRCSKYVQLPPAEAHDDA